MTRKASKVKKDFVALNLGCNRNVLKGFVNVDIVKFKGVDVATDLSKRWPWEDNSVDHIRSVDIIEHIKDKTHLMNEGWRVLREGATWQILVPHALFQGGDQDPTHVSFWVPNSFLYYSVYKDESEAYVSHSWRKLYAPHWIKAAFEIEIGVGDPTLPRDEPGGNFGGISYIAATLTKRVDPMDCEAPDGQDSSNEGSDSPEPDK